MRSVAAQKALALFALCLALASGIDLGQCAEKDNPNSSAFQKWTRIFKNEPNRGIQLLAEKYEKFGDYEKKSYFFIVANGTHFACKMLTDKPKKTDSQIIFEVNEKTLHFGYNSEKGYWALDNWDVYLFENRKPHSLQANARKDYDSRSDAEQDMGRMRGPMLGVRNVLSLGFYDIPLGNIVWENRAFSSTNILGKSVRGEIVGSSKDGLPTLARYVVLSTEGVPSPPRYIHYRYSPELALPWLPREIRCFSDENLQSEGETFENGTLVIRYTILAAEEVNKPKPLFSVNRYLVQGISSITSYSEEGAAQRREFDIAKDRKTYILGSWYPQQTVSRVFTATIGIVMAIFVFFTARMVKREARENIKANRNKSILAV